VGYVLTKISVTIAADIALSCGIVALVVAAWLYFA
jgi:hypothetical protein